MSAFASSGEIVAYALASFVAHETAPKKPDIGKLCVASEEVGMGKNFFSLAFAAPLHIRSGILTARCGCNAGMCCCDHIARE